MRALALTIYIIVLDMATKLYMKDNGYSEANLESILPNFFSS